MTQYYYHHDHLGNICAEWDATHDSVVQESGIGVSELQTQLLQKIEELTLYLIQQEQTIQELQQEVEQLKK
jgi:16S rRNA A1518/A1519 N6-dimethyltransferase RsmA/KsgA/DIM1 with predicted DNA glycosylase/AP lyase activity